MAAAPAPGPAHDGNPPAVAQGIRLFLSGDVMLGRGVDQILPYPGDATLHEPAAAATTYVELAERANGPIPKPVDFGYVWGDVLAELERARPHVRIVNLETSITTSREFAPKGINYRMNPRNTPCLTAAGVDCCVLSNNHILDFAAAGLHETLDTLESAGIRIAGAGRNAEQAAAPAILESGGNARVIVFAFGLESSGIPRAWAAGPSRPGVNLLRDLSDRTVARIAARAQAVGRPGDLLVASIHWGGNWGYAVPPEQRAFAHALIDVAGFDVIHGHSAHHAKAIEVYRGKPILYGCGDFLNDYEGIAGYEEFRGDLVVMYLPRLSAAPGRLLDFKLMPFQLRQFRLNRVLGADVAWLQATLDRESAKYGTRVVINEDSSLSVV
jgi:poly-gamma-glutamate capsule biosynthesis protein CapA/YwtB (metallophosphatase superfamily)